MKNIFKNNINGMLKNKLFMVLLLFLGLSIGFLSSYLYYGNIPLKNAYINELKSSNIEEFRVLPEITLTEDEFKEIVQKYDVLESTDLDVEKLVKDYKIDLSPYYLSRISSIEKQYDFYSNIVKRKYFVENNYTYFFTSYNTENTINKIQITKGSKDLSKGEVLLSLQYANLQNLNVGDSIEIQNNIFKIAGLYYQPSESLIYNPVYSKNIGNQYNVGVFLNDEDYVNLDGDEEYIFVAKFNDNLEENKFNNEILKMLQDEKISQVTKSKDLSNFESFQSNFETSLSIMYISLTILSFVVALLLFQILDNQIKKYSKSLGILRAIGYNKFQLSLTFIVMNIPIIIGICIGFLIGYLQSVTFIETYLTTFNFRNITPSLDLFASLLLLLSLSTILSCFNILVVYRLMSADVLESIYEREKLKVNYKLFGKLNRIWDKLPFIWRVKNNNLLKNIPRTFSVIFMGFISFVLLNFALSLSNIASKPVLQYSNSLNYKYEYIYKNTQLDDGKNTESVSYISTLLINTGDDSWENHSVQFVNQKFNSIQIRASNHENIFESLVLENSIIISKKLSEKYELNEGDQLKIKSSDGDVLSVVVAAINPIHYDNTLYLNSDFLNKVNKDLTTTSYNRKYTDELISETDGVEYQTKDDKIEQLKNLLTSSLTLIPSIIFITIFIVFSISILLAFLNIRDNKKSISIFILLGYTKKQIMNMLVNIYTVSLILGMILGLLGLNNLFKILSKYINSVVEIYIEFSVTVDYIILSAIIITIIYQLSLFSTYRTLNKIKISELNYE